MNEILKRIVDIEKEAKEVMAEITVMEKEAPEQTEKEIAALREKAGLATDEKVKAWAKQERVRCEQGKKEQEAAFAQKEQALTAAFERNKMQWENEVFHRIISR